MKRPRVKLRRVWLDGPEPGVGIFEVDPPLEPGEVEIDLADIEDRMPSDMTPAELAAFGDLTRSGR